MMRTKKQRRLLCLALIAAGAVAIGYRAKTYDRLRAKREDHWHVITVNQPLSTIAPNGELPEPLNSMLEEIEVVMQPAPGDKGTEIAARLIAPVPTGVMSAATRLSGKDPRQQLRQVLRETKSRLEAGEVVEADGLSSRFTLTNAPLTLATRLSRKEGRI